MATNGEPRRLGIISDADYAPDLPLAGEERTEAHEPRRVRLIVCSVCGAVVPQNQDRKMAGDPWAVHEAWHAEA